MENRALQRATDEAVETQQQQTPEAREAAQPEMREEPTIRDKPPAFENVDQKTDVELAKDVNAQSKAAQTEGGKRNVLKTFAKQLSRFERTGTQTPGSRRTVRA